MQIRIGQYDEEMHEGDGEAIVFVVGPTEADGTPECEKEK